MTGSLHGVGHPGDVTAAAALSWFAAASDTEIIGYLFAPDRAEWFRCDGATPRGPERSCDLATAFELAATDGRRHLRWTHHRSGTGPAVSLSEDHGLLPAGEPLPAGPRRTRLGGSVPRRLAGLVIESGDGWTTLGSGRYGRCQVPSAAEPGQEIWADLAEYTVSDEQGNLSVVDTLLLGLRPQAAKGRRS
jgi:hypothetical protein